MALKLAPRSENVKVERSEEGGTFFFTISGGCYFFPLITLLCEFKGVDLVAAKPRTPCSGVLVCCIHCLELEFIILLN